MQNTPSGRAHPGRPDGCHIYGGVCYSSLISFLYPSMAPMVFTKVPRLSLVAQLVKNPPAMQETPRDSSSIPGSGRSLGEGIGYLLQYLGLRWWFRW